MAHTIPLGRLLDIRVAIHVSWFVVFALVTWSIGSELPVVMPRALGIAVAAACALALFASVVAHEFAHAIVARRCGVRTLGITLFLFGGVATLESEPHTPRGEIAIALAGPLASALLAGLAFAVYALVDRFAGASMTADVARTFFGYAALANAALACFNLLPAFPMDGGRLVRALLWGLRRDHARATATASLLGCAVGAVAIVASATAFGVAQEWQFGWTAVLGGFIAVNGWQGYRENRTRARGAENPRVPAN